jgi:hypothetical protein
MLNPDTLKKLAACGANESEFIAAMRLVFPHGHEDFLPTTLKEMELHSLKNHDYAKGGSALGNFERVSAILALYPGLNPSDKRVIALVYMLKQLDAVLWGIAKGIAHKVEGLNERLGDISIYSKIVMCMNLQDAREKDIDRHFGLDLKDKTDLPSTGNAPIGSSANINEARTTGTGKMPGCPEFNHSRSAGAEPKRVGRSVAVSADGVRDLGPSNGSSGEGCAWASEVKR